MLSAHDKFMNNWRNILQHKHTHHKKYKQGRLENFLMKMNKK